jgi:flavin reductase (DIM6/NTAB) family NADH-FMN oxidoreductase RutF
MSKVSLNLEAFPYGIPAMPVAMVGANVNEKPNFMTVAWHGVANAEPLMIAVAIRPHRHTYKGIKQNMTFSLNVPSTDQIKEADYCGIFSGARCDKVADCNFKVFYGKLENAPMIEQCPVNVECRVAHILTLGTHAFVIGSVESVHISSSCVTDEKPDAEKIKPFIYVYGTAREYKSLGNHLAQAYTVGKELKPKG